MGQYCIIKWSDKRPAVRTKWAITDVADCVSTPQGVANTSQAIDSVISSELKPRYGMASRCRQRLVWQQHVSLVAPMRLTIHSQISAAHCEYSAANADRETQIGGVDTPMTRPMHVCGRWRQQASMSSRRRCPSTGSTFCQDLIIPSPP